MKNTPKTKVISYDPTTFLDFDEIKHLNDNYLLNLYDRLPVAFKYGSGEYLYDTEEKQYIDFLSGIAVTSVGHANPDLLYALTRQAEMLWHTSNLFYNQGQSILARALVELSFPGKVFFCNTGTEANEAGFKLVKAWGASNHKPKIISLQESFHGRTLGSASLTGQEKIRKGFGNLITGIEFIHANDIDSLVACMDNEVAGIIIEPILGEGGVIQLTKEFVETVRHLCQDYNAIMVIDEVQTGIGRSGAYFAYEHYGIVPDVLTLAKGLGGGFPIGAMIVSEQYHNVLKPGMHGTTFGGNHLAMAVGYEVLRTIESMNILQHVTTLSKYMINKINDLKKQYPNKIKDVRGLGFLLGIEVSEEYSSKDIMMACLEKRLVIGCAGNNIVRLLPPLNVRKTTIDATFTILDQVFHTI